MNDKQTFSKIAEEAQWTYSDGCISGPGSDEKALDLLTPFVAQIFDKIEIHRVLDLGCGTGSFTQVLEKIGYSGNYIGIEIAESALPLNLECPFPTKFAVGDILNDELPEADLVIVKDVLQHLPNDAIFALLKKLEKYRDVLLINDLRGAVLNELLNQDIPAGAYRPLKLNAAPFLWGGTAVGHFRTESVHGSPDTKQILLKGLHQNQLRVELPSPEKNSLMTKKIHQTWKNTDCFPDCYYPEWRESWPAQHPDWEYKIWTDEDNEQLVREHYPQFESSYSRIQKGVIKSDIARALILHQEGGIYADLDFVCLKSFEPLLSAVGNYMVFGFHEQKLQPYPNALMYSPPKHPFWLTFVEDSLDAFEWGERKVENIAGPDRLLATLEKLDPQCVILPSKLWYSNPWGHGLAAEISESVDWHNLDELRRVFPQAMAVTSWSHNW